MKILLAFLLVMPGFAFSQQSPSSSEPATSSNNNRPRAADSGSHPVDKAGAYYHFTMAHMYEEEMAASGRSDLVTKAIEQYRLAIEADPSSEYLSSGLAELYARTGRIRDAITEAQELIKRDPQNLEAHRLLGHIYLRSLGDMQGGNGSENVLKLAIEQYQEIVRLDANSVDDHIMLGRLYHADNQGQKAEEEEKAAVKL